MSCEHEDRLVELVYEELDLEESRALRQAAEACPHCAGLLASLEEAKGATESLTWIEAPADLDGPILAAARAQADLNRARHAPSPWARFKQALEAFTLGPQVAMATVMMLVVAIGLWYVPEEPQSRDLVGGTVVTPDPEGRAVATTADEDFQEPEIAPTETVAPLAEPGARGPARTRAAVGGNVAQPAREARRAAASRSGALSEDLQVAPDTDQNVPSIAEAQNRADGDAPAIQVDQAQGFAPSAMAAPSEPSRPSELSRQAQTAPTAPTPTAEREEARPATGELVPVSLFALARRHRENGACQTATQHYEDLIRRFPDAPQVPQALVEAADCFRRLGSTTRARELLERAERFASTRAVATRELRRLDTLRAARRRAAPAATDSFEASEAY